MLYVGHADGLAPALSGRRNLCDWAGLNGLAATPERIDAALATVGAGAFADLPVRLLSRGQRRRLALARLALSPGARCGFSTSRRPGWTTRRGRPSMR